MISIYHWHHKPTIHQVTPFEGPHADLVNAVRVADHIDFTFGFLAKGMPWTHIRTVSSAIPEGGFHASLVALLPRIRGWNTPKALWELSSIFKW